MSDTWQVVIGLAAPAATAFGAWLLYLSGQKSAERERLDRKEERDNALAEADAARTHELTLRKEEREAEAAKERAQAAKELEERAWRPFVRFLTLAQQIAVLRRTGGDADPLAKEYAEALEGALLFSASQDLHERTMEVDVEVRAMLSTIYPSDQYGVVADAMDRLRERIRSEMSTVRF